MARRNLDKTEYLIIGNSAGGIGAAEAIREIDTNGRLVIVSDEPYPAYSRPLISEYLSHERTTDTMLFRSPDFYDRNRIELLSNTKIIKISPEDRTVQFENGTILGWQKLLLSTGGAPIIPSIKGLDKEGVFSFIKLEDARKIDEYLPVVNRAVIIGGGLIGISVCEALSKRSVPVTVVEMKDRVLNMILDDHASNVAESIILQHGVHVITNNTVAEITGNGRVEGIKLSSGESIACDMVIAAIGVIPRLDLINRTGIEVNRGIIIDRQMSTSCRGIYACGDVAEGYDFITGSSHLTPIWPNAFIGGRVAGHNMAGLTERYSGGTAMNSINYFGIDIVSAGLVSAPAGKQYEELTYNKGSIYKKLILKNGIIKGMLFIEEIEKAGMVFGLIRDKVNVNSFKNTLLRDDFGLIDLPVKLRRERMGILTGRKHIVPLKEADEQPVAGE